MTYRPRSSVTTILANFVGRSLVSAITQTPASGPPGPVTTPPRSRSPILNAGSGDVCACTQAGDVASTDASANATKHKAPTVIFVISQEQPCRRRERGAGHVTSALQGDNGCARQADARAAQAACRQAAAAAGSVHCASVFCQAGSARSVAYQRL